jgi:hypothetical protein
MYVPSEVWSFQNIDLTFVECETITLFPVGKTIRYLSRFVFFEKLNGECNFGVLVSCVLDLLLQSIGLLN